MVLSRGRTRNDSDSDNTTLQRNLAGSAFACVLLAASLVAAPASAQDRRAVVFGEIGGASIGHADSQQGGAPIFGGGAAFHLTPRLVVEGDVHGGRVEHVFGREHHDFTQLTSTASLLFRTPARGQSHFVAGGGWAVQRAHVVFDEPPFGRVDEVEVINLMHGRIGVDWDVSNRFVMRTAGVLWIGGGLDWILGAHVGLGYRF